MPMFPWRCLRTGLLALSTLGALAAQAAPLTALEVLQQFNLVTLGSTVSSSHVDGRAFIGGSLNGNGAVVGMHPSTTPASAYAALTVAGSVSGTQVTAGGITVLGNASNVTVNNGPAAIAGNASNSNFNGTGGVYTGGTRSGVNANSGSLGSSAAAAQLATATSTDFTSVLGGLSSTLSLLPSTGSYWDVAGSRVTFHAVADSSGLAVFDLSSVGQLLSYGEFNFDLGSASSVIFNSDVTSATISANFLGGSAQALSSKVIWNFYNATTLTLNAQFGGSVLATGADLRNSNNIEGGVYVKTLNQQGEIHQGAYAGVLPAGGNRSSVSAQVPEPASWLLVGLALAAGATATGIARRAAARRRAAA